jgi:hypothetical protein
MPIFSSTYCGNVLFSSVPYSLAFSIFSTAVNFAGSNYISCLTDVVVVELAKNEVIESITAEKIMQACTLYP